MRVATVMKPDSKSQPIEKEQRKPPPQPRRAAKDRPGVTQNSVLNLQRSIGNQGVLSLLHAGAIQAKLRVSQPGDADEREADRVAQEIVSSPNTKSTVASATSPTLHRKCNCPGGGATCPDCEAEEVEEAKGIHRKSASNSPDDAHAPDNLLQNLGPGSPLEPAVRENMESSFGRDFGDVRIHSDTRAAQSARAVNARAFTLGKDVVFDHGQYSPGTQSGKQLLAHELTHVVQQEGTVGGRTPKPVAAYGGAKTEASSASDRTVGAAASRATAPSIQRVSAPAVMRAPLFDSTMQICQRVLKSRVFHVSEGGVVVTANAAWEPSPEWRGADRPACGREVYEMELSRVGTLWDSSIDSCEFHHGAPMSRNWTNLPEGDYYLTIVTNNTNPNCCLQGTIQVSQQRGLTGPSCGGGPARDVASMPTAEKISRAVSLSGEKLGGQAGERIKELLTPQAIGMMAAFTAAYIVSQTTPIGWVADILVAGLIAATVLMVGSEAAEIVRLLIEFFDMASSAKSDADLDKAADLFAKAITKAGIDIIIAIIFHKAGKAADLKPPGPRSAGLVEVLAKGGAKLSTVLGPPEYAELVTEGGSFRVPVERVPNAMMMEAQKPGGASPKGGGTVETAGRPATAGGEPTKSGQPSTGDLPGKKTVAAEGLSKNLSKLGKDPAVDTETTPKEPKKETGAQQEKRLLKEDRASGRPANSATYHAYEGGTRGSFRGWVNSLKSHIDSVLKNDPARPQLNETLLAENTHQFIDRHPNLRAAWEKMNLKIDSQLREIQAQRSAAAGDKVRLAQLNKLESALQTRRAELTDIETSDIGNKRPDLVEVFIADRHAVVTDITQRTGDALHNFKTELYIAVIKDILGWTDVDGINFNTVYDQNVTP